MRVITVARKPLVGSVARNVLQHGTGALNIDACRVGAEKRTYKGCGAVPTKLLNYGKGNTGIGYMDGSSKDREYTAEGRWPANLILQHHPECQRAGETKVGGSLRHPTGRDIYGQSNPFGWNSNQVKDTTVRGFAEETLEVWDCHPECPVAALNGQFGETTSSGGRTCNISKTSTIYGGGKGLGQDKSPEEVRGDPGFGDTGGVSRYFKQVGTLQSPEE